MPLTRCPKRLFMPGSEDEDGVSELLWYYANYKRGVLPDQGGLLDQSGHLMQLFRIIDGAVATIERYQQEELEKERERNARAARGRGGPGRRR